MKCTEVNELIDMVASDEMFGVDVDARYPAVMTHIRRCGRCRAAYILLMDLLQAAEEPLPSSVPVPSFDFSFLEEDAREEEVSSQQIGERDTEVSASCWHLGRQNDSAPPDTEKMPSWRRLIDDISSLFPLRYEIRPGFLRQALRGPSLAAARGDSREYAERRALLLSDWITTEQGEWIVELITYRSVDRPDVLDLEARLVSEEPLPPDLQVVLSGIAQPLTAPLDEEGIALFRDLPLSLLISQPGESRDDLTISFLQP